MARKRGTVSAKDTEGAVTTPAGKSKSTPSKSKRAPEVSTLPTSAMDSLTLKQRTLVEAYTDPHSPTYGNKTQSYLRASPNVTYKTAGAEGVTTLAKPRVQLAVKEELEAIGIGRKVRNEVLRSIVSGSHRQTVEQTYQDGDKIRKQTTISTPRAHDQVSAIRELNKIDGTYAEAAVAGDIARDEYHRLLDNVVGEALGPVAQRKRTYVRVCNTPQKDKRTRNTHTDTTDADTQLDTQPTAGDSVSGDTRDG